MPRFRVAVRLVLEVQAPSLPDAWATLNDYFHVGRRFSETDEPQQPMRLVEMEIGESS